jgi:hypothetical protein
LIVPLADQVKIPFDEFPFFIWCEMSATDEMRNPNHTFQPTPTSGRGRGLLFGGCGCLLVLAIICGVGGYFLYARLFKPTLDFTFEAQMLATESPEVKEILGEPITAGTPDTSTVGERIILRIPVKGSKGSGIVVVEGQFIFEGGVGIRRISTLLEHDGETTDLDPDAMTPEIEVKYPEE